jgi:hypothetical protein
LSRLIETAEVERSKAEMFVTEAKEKKEVHGEDDRAISWEGWRRSRFLLVPCVFAQ